MMDNSFFAYLQQLELMAFFSAYPLIYTVSFFIAGNPSGTNIFKKRILPLISYSYAFTGTLYLGLQIRNLYPDYSIESISIAVTHPWLTGWGLLSLLFWIPALSRRPILSLVHSLVIFFLLAKDLFLHTVQSSADRNVVKNDMKIYTDSILLNLGSLIAIVIISLLIAKFKSRKASSLMP